MRRHHYQKCTCKIDPSTAAVRATFRVSDLIDIIEIRTKNFDRIRAHLSQSLVFRRASILSCTVRSDCLLYRRHIAL